MKSKKEVNPRVMKILRRRHIADKHGGCDRCPPHGGENARNVRKHGRQKPKYKNKRR